MAKRRQAGNPKIKTKRPPQRYANKAIRVANKKLEKLRKVR